MEPWTKCRIQLTYLFPVNYHTTDDTISKKEREREAEICQGIFQSPSFFAQNCFGLQLLIGFATYIIFYSITAGVPEPVSLILSAMSNYIINTTSKMLVGQEKHS